MERTTIMNGRLHFFRNRIVVILLPLVLFALFSSTKARAQQDPAKNTGRDEQKLVEKVKEEVIKTYKDKVNWVYRHFPLTFHNPGAQKQAEASECAHELGGNDAFWKYSDAIYERTQSNGKGFPLTQIVPLAKEIGLDEKKFAQCYDSGKYEPRVKEDLEEGGKIGITGTPANIHLHH